MPPGRDTTSELQAFDRFDQVIDPYLHCQLRQSGLRDGLRPTSVWRKQMCDFCLSGECQPCWRRRRKWLSLRPRSRPSSRPVGCCAPRVQTDIHSIARHALRCSIHSPTRPAVRRSTTIRPYPDQFALKQHVTEARDPERTLCGSLNARVQHAEKISEDLYTKCKSGLRCTQIKCCVMIRRNDFKRSANIACREGGMRKGLWRVTGASGSQSGSFILTLCNNRTC